MTLFRAWYPGLLAAVLTVLAGRWGLGLFTESEYVHFSVNFPTASGEPQMQRNRLGGPWLRIADEEWTGYPGGGLLVWGREGRLEVDIGKRGILKKLFQPSVLLVSSHWIRNVGVGSYRVRMEFDSCGLPVKWLTFESDWDESTHTTTRQIEPGDSFNMDWRIETRPGIEKSVLPCNGSLRLFDARSGKLLTLFPVIIKSSSPYPEAT